MKALGSFVSVIGKAFERNNRNVEQNLKLSKCCYLCPRHRVDLFQIVGVFLNPFKSLRKHYEGHLLISWGK